MVTREIKNFQSIVLFLANKRCKLAVKRHEHYRYWSLFKTGHANAPEIRVPDTEQMISQYLPPRRQWKRINRTKRQKECITSNIQKRSIVCVVMAAYYAWISQEYTEDTLSQKLDKKQHPALDALPWGQKLINLTTTINKRLTQSHIHLEPPRINFIPKDKDHLRCIASFQSVEDSILLSLATRSLTCAFDPLFTSSSYAFRLPEKSRLVETNQRKSSTGYTRAVEDILAFRKEYSEQPLYVAECDIQKFYDTINHHVIRNAIHDLKQQYTCNTSSKEIPIKTALKIVEAYLTCYNYKDNVEALQKDNVDGVSKETFRTVYKRGRIPYKQIGIPQGGALSPLLANCVLHQADKAIAALQKKHPGRLFYARFCDDMLLISPDMKLCEKAFQPYCDCLNILHLPIHEPISPTPSYGKKWWETKTRTPYCWASGKIPWIGFVGYQIRYDGHVRIRQQNIERIQARMEKEIHQATYAWKSYINQPKIKKPTFINTKKILTEIIGHFTCSLVGKPNERFSRNDRAARQSCWIDAFPLAYHPTHISEAVQQQWRGLDKLRNRLITGFQKSLDADPNHALNYKVMTAFKKNGGRVTKTHFWGKPFSFFGAATAERNIFFKDDSVRKAPNNNSSNCNSGYSD